MIIKKLGVFTLLFSLVTCSFISSTFAEIAPPKISGKAYYLKDYTSGVVLAGNNSSTPLSLASMSKLMTEYLVLEKIKQGKLHWTDKVTVSAKAAAINESEIKLVKGEKISVKELFTGMMVQSANDAAYALAEKVSGTETNFVKLMNQQAKTFGLTKTYYYTCNGLVFKSSNGKIYNNYMSAYDITRLARYLLGNHPEVYQFTKITSYTFHPGTSRQQKVLNTNAMLPKLSYAYAGVDGIKTGYTSSAGYCFAGTVNRNNFRLISVMMGTSSTSARFTETKKLYDYAYQEFTQRTFFKAGTAVPGHGTMTVKNHSGSVPIVALKEMTFPVHKNQASNYTYRVVLNNVQAPLPKGAIVGTVQVYYKNAPISGLSPVPLVTATEVKKNLLARYFSF